MMPNIFDEPDFYTVEIGDCILQKGVPVIRSILMCMLVFLIFPTNAHAGNSEIQSIQDICGDAPQWLVKLDKNEPLWLTENLVNSTVIDWEGASYTEKMATLAVYLIYHEYKREPVTSDNDMERDSGYQCTGIIDILDQEIGKHYLPNDFPVWECVQQMIELSSGTESFSFPNG